MFFFKRKSIFKYAMATPNRPASLHHTTTTGEIPINVNHYNTSKCKSVLVSWPPVKQSMYMKIGCIIMNE